LLNFGPAGVIPMFALYGSLLGWYRRKLTSWRPSDARMFVAPLFTILFANALVSDSDNIIYAVVIQGVLVSVAIFAVSNRLSPGLEAATHAKSVGR